jgi:hypothetical protein
MYSVCDLLKLLEASVHLSKVVENNRNSNKNDQSHDNHRCKHWLGGCAASLHTSRILGISKVSKHQEEEYAVDHDCRNSDRFHVQPSNDAGRVECLVVHVSVGPRTRMTIFLACQAPREYRAAPWLEGLLVLDVNIKRIGLHIKHVFNLAKSESITNIVLHFDIVLCRSPRLPNHFVKWTDSKLAVWFNWTLSGSLDFCCV